MFKLLQTDERPVGGRVSIFGEPNTLKTTSIVKTWPRPMAIVSAPGEKGWETIPRNDPEILPFFWEMEFEKSSPRQVLTAVEKFVFEVLAGKHGKVVTLAFEGAHKYYDWYYKAALEDKMLLFGDEEKARWPAYSKAHDEYGLFFTKVLTSAMPYIVVTLWEDLVKDNPSDTSRTASKHKYPDLPQKMAKNFPGEFSATLYSKVTKPDPRGSIKGYWLTRAVGEVWGVGVKVPPDIAKNIPEKIPQDFQILRRLMSGEKVDPKLLEVPII